MKDLKAHVNLATGKIYGCKRGSWEWWHEKGHIEFNERADTSFILLCQSYVFNIWMVAMMFAVLFKTKIIALIISAFLWAIYIGINLYEEHWCNEYANRKVFKPK